MKFITDKKIIILLCLLFVGTVVLGGAQAINQIGLEWNMFTGSVKQFHALKKLFAKYDIEDLKGEDGQKKVAQEVFEGNKLKAYRNVSILRKELLDDSKIFQELRWLENI